VLEDYKLALCGLQQKLIGIVALKCPCDRLTAGDQADSDLLISELGDEFE